MKHINVTTARKEIYTLLKEVHESCNPIMITSKVGDAILVSAEDWQAVQETLYLLSIPSMREDLIAGMNSTSDECISRKELDW